MGVQWQAGEKGRVALIADRYVVLVVGVVGGASGAIGGPIGGAIGGSFPGVELVVCDDVDEAIVWLQGSRSWSALLVDRSHPALSETARRLGIPMATLPTVDLPAFLRERATPIRSAHDLRRCGAALAALCHAAPAGGPGPAAAFPLIAGPEPTGGMIITVCGPGGTGASTVAMAVAAGVAARHGAGVLLADLALRAGQAVLHPVAPTSAGLEELVHAHGSGRLSTEEVRAQTIAVDGPAYRLLVGLHRPSHWTAIRPTAFDATLESLRATFSVVVADVTGDLEGEAETGSTDIEERNHMARRTIATSDVIVVVGAEGATGRRALDATAEAVGDHIGGATRMVKVLNRGWSVGVEAGGDGGGEGGGTRDAAGGGAGGGAGRGAGGVDPIVVGRVPASGDLVEWGRPITDAIAALLSAHSRSHPRPQAGLVSPGSIGHWTGAR